MNMRILLFSNFEMAPKKKAKNVSSRRSVTCGACSKTLERRDRLKSHFESYHPGENPYEKGQTQLNFLSPTCAQKRSVSQNENIFSPSDDRCTSDSSVSININDISPIGSPLFHPISSSIDDTDSEIVSTAERPVPFISQPTSSVSANENFLV